MTMARVAVLITLAVTLLAACSGSGAPVENGPAGFTGQLKSIQAGEGEKRLRDLVPGDWTTVRIFAMESLIREDVEREVGFDLALPADNYFVAEGSVFVFANDDEVVWAAAVYGVEFGLAHTVGNEDSVVGRKAGRSHLELT